MKKNLFLIILFVTITSVIFAQKRGNNDFATFWKTFKTALSKDNKLTITNLTYFPFGVDSIDKKQFIKKYNLYFDKQKKACLTKQTPIKNKGVNDMYEIFCGINVYIFKKDKNGWKFYGGELF